MNILILSCGIRNKIVQYFKKELSGLGQVIATDYSRLAPALYDANRHFIVPEINKEYYVDIILAICKKNNIKGVFSLIDPELSILAENKERFLDIGTIPIISNPDVIELSYDKYKMYEFLVENNFSTIKTYIDKEKFYDDVNEGILDYPVFIKPRKGSGSTNINKADSKEEVEFLFNKFDNLVIQEYIRGVEHGVDCYIDMISNETVAMFAKEKIKMRAGETDKSLSVKDGELFKLLINFIRKAGYKGVIDIDLFKVDGDYYISEVNPRFGGGYLHGYECGVNIPKMIIENLKGNINKNVIGNYEESIYLMKYSEFKTIK